MLPVDPGVVPEVVEAYRTAWGAWHSRVEALHAVALDGRALAPPQHKSMLDREALAKQRYDAARRALLGIADSLT